MIRDITVGVVICIIALPLLFVAVNLVAALLHALTGHSITVFRM
jgi:hypothetical protein